MRRSQTGSACTKRSARYPSGAARRAWSRRPPLTAARSKDLPIPEHAQRRLVANRAQDLKAALSGAEGQAFARLLGVPHDAYVRCSMEAFAAHPVAVNACFDVWRDADENVSLRREDVGDDATRAIAFFLSKSKHCRSLECVVAEALVR